MEPKDLPRPVYVNTLLLNGFLNGICNLAFATASWYPRQGDGKVEVAISEPITVDIRMDLSCAIATRDALNRIIDENSKPNPSAVN